MLICCAGTRADNDVGRPTSKVGRIRTLFQEAHAALQAYAFSDAPAAYNVLGTVLGVSEAVRLRLLSHVSPTEQLTVHVRSRYRRSSTAACSRTSSPRAGSTARSPPSSSPRPGRRPTAVRPHPKDSISNTSGRTTGLATVTGRGTTTSPRARHHRRRALLDRDTDLDLGSGLGWCRRIRACRRARTRGRVGRIGMSRRARVLGR